MVYKIARIHPVVYTGTAGGGENEFQASNSANVFNKHTLDVPLPAGNGVKIVDAWYQLRHNLAALDAFAGLAVGKKNNKQVLLKAAGYAGTNERIRLTICVLYQV